MDVLSYLKFIFSILLIIILLKQYVEMWILLDKLNRKVLKYMLPICEILLLFFYDGLFLFPSVVVFLILIYKFNILDNNMFKTFYPINKHKFSINISSILQIIFLSPFLFFIFQAIISFSSNNGGNNLIYQKQLIDYLTFFVLTSIIAPIVEEFTFRVLIYDNWLSSLFNKKIVAVLISSVIFAFTHFDYKTYIYTFITGASLCFIYDIYGYLCSVILHMLFNTYSFLGMLGVNIEWKKLFIASFILLAISAINYNGNYGLKILRKRKNIVR
ncbi:CAAX protease self-immunity [Caloranaerobacter azorensis DSM 13643]|uniref:CAAX protease self-immunity n=1 Tax=Caloranaerobacter azorensis DSM 13643 TaxID=1121264 RepID=A0A1M5S4X4_9FIRM|nr:type II CAAX endopeptidase family protein [Caloranaerobacter azorensis]SHH33023.1 CAAX protease self-immunity [Caloranaerobacter azorensis DSM 13643]